MERIWKIIALFCLLSADGMAEAGSLYFGVGHGPQGGLDEPKQYNGVVDLGYSLSPVVWHRFEFSIGAGLTWMWTKDGCDDEVFAVSMFPVARFYFWQTDEIGCYAMAAAGPTFLTESQLGDMELGGNFAFNDLLGLGCRFGDEAEWSVTLGWRHISNAGLFDPNDGFDVPCFLMLGRRF